MRASLVSVLLLAALVPLAPPAAAAEFTVTASNFQWSPAALTVAPGDTVTFTNGGGSHNWVTSDGTDSCSLPCTRSWSEPRVVEYECGIHPSMTGTITVAVSPSVSITSPAPGATLSGTVRVEGTAVDGSAAITSVQVTLRGATVSANLSGPGPARTWSADVATASLENGAATLTALATDANGAQDEASLSVTISNPLVVDLRVSALSAGGGVRALPITVGLANDGNVPTGPFRLVAEYLYQGEWHLIASVEHAGLGAGAMGTTTLSWQPLVPNVGQFTIRARADVDEEVPDVDRSNNVRTGTASWFTPLVPGIVPTDP